MNKRLGEPDKWERDRVAWNLPRPTDSKPVDRQGKSVTKPASDPEQRTLKLRDKR